MVSTRSTETGALDCAAASAGATRAVSSAIRNRDLTGRRRSRIRAGCGGRRHDELERTDPALRLVRHLHRRGQDVALLLDGDLHLRGIDGLAETFDRLADVGAAEVSRRIVAERELHADVLGDDRHHGVVEDLAVGVLDVAEVVHVELGVLRPEDLRAVRPGGPGTEDAARQDDHSTTEETLDAHEALHCRTNIAPLHPRRPGPGRNILSKTGLEAPRSTTFHPRLQ